MNSLHFKLWIKLKISRCVSKFVIQFRVTEMIGPQKMMRFPQGLFGIFRALLRTARVIFLFPWDDSVLTFHPIHLSHLHWNN